jgi:DNA helicase-2/ATP-dependent DNA helicase PcrA
MAKKKFRPEQEQIISGYTQGRVGIAAVPGSGKTFTLAHLAARLVATHISLAKEQEVLIVTFTNTAVNSFRKRIDRVLSEDYGLIPYVGYRVRTLHGLAHDIVRERPALVGLADDFIILDEKIALEIQRDLVAQHLPDWWDRLSAYANPDMNPKTLHRNFEQDLPELVTRFIQRSKDLRRTPDELYLAVQGTDARFDLARFAITVYMDYQRSLAYRGAVDFDDLVRLALQTLDLDDHYLRRLQDRWPYILEDEAQDSSRLQEDMLSRLSRRNWVRVGDPNQAINTTFTTASPFYLLDFLGGSDVVERPLSVSGRSAPAILALANELVRWTVEEHPVPELRNAFDLIDDREHGIRRGLIKATPKRDPQPNPPDDSFYIHIEYRPDQKLRPEKELEMIVSGEEYSLLSWLHEIEQLPEAERPTVAVLVPENSRGFKLAEMLRKYNVRYEELLRSTTATRQTVTTMRLILEYLSDPADLKALKQLFWALMSESHRDLVKEDADLRQAITKTFADFKNLEDFLWPTTRLEIGSHLTSYQSVVVELEGFRIQVRRWLQAVILPVDQLVLTISQDRFTDPVDVALGYKVAVLLRDMAGSHPDWRLPQFVEELRIISNNERKFIGFDDADAGYEPKPGVVTIATMHAAKGLEWDRVYLMSVSNYGFPSALPYDSYIGERWYVRDRLNLEAEILAQLEALLDNKLFSYTEGSATLAARLDYAKERLRLLYVGITRAKRELIVTWNMGRFWQDGKENQPALPIVMLNEFMLRNKV